MGESVPARDTGGLGDEPVRDRLLEDLQQPVSWHVGRVLEDVRHELPADHRCDGEDAVALLREHVEPAGDHLPYALRNAELPVRALAYTDQASLAHKQPHDLPQEERIPLGLAMDAGHERGRGRHARRHLDVAGDVLLAEPAERDAVSDRLAGERPQRLEERVLPAELDIAVGADDQQARDLHLSREELEQQQRGLVGPVEIIEEQHEGPPVRCVLEERRNAVEEPEARLLRLEGRQS